ncbi:PREDICTED: E3 ubiquitin-protein ligase UPL1-like isoform X2 [Tarenaya hassleriana]|uniref:E3 ubiquitin-protein ligase UPL1-like isoform X1 n=1 Tax=Tarenaya hassleriana TaxID=28532 RepID=UPI00053C693B|nr:PREDICTED: E3 ubiquitin-protein ligase UPL1-like isoform X1 [Tarenaya hassleriana]XP_010542519.1 PREDICTED: E3 ubiquitin-protein ligase UPL1-like isoform X2 [Tarenaya hassleriana]
MKLRKRRASEAPPTIRSFISSVTAVPLEQIEEPLKYFRWEFNKGDFHHWVDLFNHFDTFFDKHIKPRNDLHIENNFLASDPPFPKEAVLQVLRVIRIVLENCTNKHFYSSYEQHLSLLLASTDGDIVEACLQTLAAFLKRQTGKYSIKDASLNSKLFSLAQGWGGKEEGLGLTSCATETGCDQISRQLGCTLHFEFYDSSDSSTELPEGLQIIHVPDVNLHSESDLELLNKLVCDYSVPSSLRFSLLTRLRFARAFWSLATRQQYTCIRLYAFIVLVQASSDTDNVVSFFNEEPEFVNELVTLLSYEDIVPEKMKILCLLALVALSQDRTRQPTVLTAVTSGRNRGMLSSLLQKAIDSVTHNTSKWSLAIAEALLSLVTVLVSSSSGCSAMREVGLIPTLVPLIKDTDPQHLHLVCTAVSILEAFMDYSNPAVALFRDLGGLDDTISRLKLEISLTEDDLKENGGGLDGNESGSQGVTGSLVGGSHTGQIPYSDVSISYNRRLFLKALLRAISLGTYAPGNTTRIYGSEENLLPECLVIMFRRAKYFGGGVFSLAATVMSDLIHKDPTSFHTLDSVGISSAFLDTILDGVICSAKAITCIPQCLDALCLSNSGLQAVKDRNALRCFVKVFTSKSYFRALTGDTPSSLSSGLDELLRHQSSLRTHGVDMLVEILNTILKIGSGHEATTSISTDVHVGTTPVPMETNVDEKSLAVSEEAESSSDTISANIEEFLPDCVCNVARLFETVLQNAEVCRLFVEKKGIDAVLQLFTLPLMPVSTSLGQNFSVAFKNFSPQHSASMARTVCSYLREHLKHTNELLVSIEGTQLLTLASVEQTKILRSLSGLEGMLSLSSFLLKGTASVVSELSAADADILKYLGQTYMETIWQMALYNDSKEGEKKGVDQEANSSVAASSNVVARESDDDSSNASTIRYMNPVSVRSNNFQSIWGGDREFLSVIRSSEGIHGRTAHAIARRIRRHLEAFNFSSEIPPNLPETSSSQTLKKKSTDVLIIEILNKLNSTLRYFFTALVKGFTSPNRRRIDGATLSSASKTLGIALAKMFLEALNFQGYSAVAGHDIPLSVKCRYLGKVVDDITALTFDTRRRTCFTAMVNSFYVHGTFKELLTTFEATSQLLWTLPFNIPAHGIENEKPKEGDGLSHSSWLVDTLQSYCRTLEYFVNSAFLLSPTSTSQMQLLVQPASVGLSIGLFPVPREPEAFVRNLQSQVLDVILPILNHPMFPDCNPNFVASITALVTHIYSGVVDTRQNHSGISRSSNQRVLPPQLDEATVATIVEMGFSRARAEESLRRIGTNSVEMAMEWLFSHPEDPVQEDDELARALALSLGNSSEIPKVDGAEKPVDSPQEEAEPKEPLVDDIIVASVKLFQSNDSMAFPLTDLFMTLCRRNKGGDRPKVVSHLIQQLKLTPLDFSKDTGALTVIAHILALVLLEDDNTREIAAEDGIVSVAIDILTDFKLKNESANEILAPKCVSALLLVLSMMLQTRPRVSSGTAEANQSGSLHGSSEQHDSSLDSAAAFTKRLASDIDNKERDPPFEMIFGKSTGYLTAEEGQKALLIVCDLIKQCVPDMVMQAVLQLCARLTKTHSLAIQFLKNGGLPSLFSLPKKCFFPGYDTVTAVIVRHLVEDPQTLQIAMESEIRQILSGKRHIGRILPRTFLTTMAPVVSRDPVVFMKAVASTCQLESSGGREFVVLSKSKEKPKVSGSEHGFSSNEPLRISEHKPQDGSGKCSKGHRKVPANLSQVIDQLIDIVLRFSGAKGQEDDETYLDMMEVDEPTTTVKGKSKVGDARKAEFGFEKSEGLARVTFILKLLSDITLMYVHATNVILKRDADLSQLRGSSQPDDSPGHGGVLYHIIHRLLPITIDKLAGPDEWKKKLSEKASWFLVVLCSRSSEGRKRVITELAKVLSSFAVSGRNSSKNLLLPDKRVLAFVDLVSDILSKNLSSSNLPGSGCSLDVAKSMIDGGIIQCLTDILQVIDLDHPDAPKLVTLILKSLETLTRAANATEQVPKSESSNKKKSTGSNERHNNRETLNETEADEHNQNCSSQQGVTDATLNGLEQPQVASQSEGEHDSNQTRSFPQDMRIEVDETMPSEPIQMDFMCEDIEGGVLHNTDQIEMTFHIENRADHDVDDDMGDDGEDEEDDDEGDDEDEELVEDGAGIMSLAETDVEDPEDAGLGDEYNDDMIEEDDDDDFHENRVIEVRWREAHDGLDHFQILGQPGGGNGFIDDLAAEPFEGVNVDDLLGLRRPLGFERRRQIGRASFVRSGSEVHGFQHPLFSRPLQTADMASLSATAGNLSRDSEAGNYDVGQFYMFDTPVLPYDQASSNLFGDRLGGGAPPPLTDYSVDSSRRWASDGRWTDDGHPQPSTQAAAIAQAAEEQFISRLHASAPARIVVERQPHSSEVQEQQQSDAHPADDSQTVLGDGNRSHQHCEGLGQSNNNNSVNDAPDATVQIANQDQANIASPTVHDAGECLQQHELYIQPRPLNSASNAIDRMEVAESNGIAVGQSDVDSAPLISPTQGQHGDPANIENVSVTGMSLPDNGLTSMVQASTDVDMGCDSAEGNQNVLPLRLARDTNELSSVGATEVAMEGEQVSQDTSNNGPSGANAIDPAFLEALPEDLRAEVLASQQAQSVQPPAYAPSPVDDIDPEFLAALPPDIQAEVLAQQRAQQIVQQSQGQPVDMDNASIIATLPADLREEVLLTSSEAVLAALPSPLLAEAQMLRDRAMSHYQVRSLFGGSRLNNRRNGLGYNRSAGTDRGVGVTIGQSAVTSAADGLKVKEIEGEPLLNVNGLKSLVKLLRLAQPLGKGLLQRLLLNLCAHSVTRAKLVLLLLDMIRPETEISTSGLETTNPQRLYGCQSNVVYGRSQLLNGVPPLVFRRVLEVLTYMATNHSAVADMLFYFDSSLISRLSGPNPSGDEDKGEETATERIIPVKSVTQSWDLEIPLVLFLKLLSRPLLLQSTSHLGQVMGLLQVIVNTAASLIEGWSPSSGALENSENKLVDEEASNETRKDPESSQGNKADETDLSVSGRKKCAETYNVFLQLPQSDLRNLCSLLGREGLSDKIYSLSGEVLKKLGAVAVAHRKFFTKELSELASSLSASTVNELTILRNAQKIGLSTGSMAGESILRVLQVLSSLTSPANNNNVGSVSETEQEEQDVMLGLNMALEPLWQELSECITMTEMQLDHTVPTTTSNVNPRDHVQGASPSSPLPPGTQKLLPLIEAFFVLCEKIQINLSILQQDHANVTAGEVKEAAHGSYSVNSTSVLDSQKKLDGSVTFAKFAEKHRRLLNAFVRQNPSLLEKSLSMMLKAPRLIDFDNKKAYFRSRIRQQHDQHISGPLRISVRRAYVLEDSYNQLRMRSPQDLKGRLNVQFQGEEGIDAGGLTREWYQLLSRVIFDKGALLFTTVGNNVTFQPNPNSVYQTEHLSYFKFVGRVVAKALLDGQLLDVYLTRSFYKHILGVKVTYHDIEAVDPDYYKNLKWLLENDVSDILDLTFSMDADEEKHILYEKAEVTDYELKPGGRNIRVTEETKHEYVDLVASHILTNAIRPQINAFLEGFNELIPRDLVSMFNDKELELLISGLPEIDLDDLKANTEYTGYTPASPVVQWFWEVVKAFSKEDMARLLQFVTGTSKVPLEGFKALQGISGPQRFQIHKAYGAPERLPSAHTCFNQLDLPEYSSKEQLQERLLLAIHEASEGFGFA